ncbi:HET-domain-containing protein [Glonium stellatum]|uniref:HET-domain-containing protein n=1 Tax=Glonium stellatum TaxID=574774 RepID=A0A8E2JVQ0_9PEZI|nr:HET-domain-containing protein [Glonium stellatum]
MPLCEVCVVLNFRGLLYPFGRNTLQGPNLRELLHPIGQATARRHRDLETLRSSASTCELCALLQAAIQDSVQPHESKNRIYLQGDRNFSFLEEKSGSYDSDIGALTSISIYLGSLDGTGKLQTLRHHPITVYAEPGSAAALSYDILNQPLRPSDDVTQARQWFQHCSSTHSICHKRSSGDETITEKGKLTYLPTRVLDVTAIASNGNPFLVETEGQQGEYVTLSHRWGGARVVTTTLSNLIVHKRCIPFATLSKTFRDAIVFTYNLGFRYIWIDSLCIIQDSVDDWERESARMAEIYMQSTITLSAASATSGDTGLFLPRKPYMSVKLPYCDKHGALSGHYYITNRQLGTFLDEVERGPLQTRAWTLQERLLAARVLHFAESQLYWECQNAVWKESSGFLVEDNAVDRFGGNVKTGYRGSLLSAPWRKSEFSLPRQAKTNAEYTTWYGVLSQYSRRAMSYEDDKLPAVSGLAQYFAQYRKDSYVAGLWNNDLPTGLMWCNGHSRGSSSLLRPKRPRAPSFSWASLDGPIVFECDWTGTVEIKILDVAVQHSGSNRYGGLASGRILLMGCIRQLKTVVGQAAEYDRGWIYTNAFLFNAEDECLGCASFDELSRTQNGLVSCLLIFCVSEGFRPFAPDVLMRRGQWAWALLLRRKEDEMAYERIGLAQVDQTCFEKMVMEEIALV